MNFKGDQVGVNVALKVGLKLGLSQVKFLTKKKTLFLKVCNDQWTDSLYWVNQLFLSLKIIKRTIRTVSSKTEQSAAVQFTQSLKM